MAVSLNSYDADGNVTSISPPGQPRMSFDYTPVDLQRHTPPGVPNDGTGRTVYTYNADRQLRQVARPDGKRWCWITIPLDA
jgi:YD repeat-containing protein